MWGLLWLQRELPTSLALDTALAFCFLFPAAGGVDHQSGVQPSDSPSPCIVSPGMPAIAVVLAKLVEPKALRAMSMSNYSAQFWSSCRGDSAWILSLKGMDKSVARGCFWYREESRNKWNHDLSSQSLPLSLMWLGGSNDNDCTKATADEDTLSLRPVYENHFCAP